MPKPKATSKAEELTPEQKAKEDAAKLKAQQEADLQAFNKEFAWFEKWCDRWRPLWDKRLNDIMAQEAKRFQDAQKASLGLSSGKRFLAKALSRFGLRLVSCEANLPVPRTYEQIAAEIAQEAKNDVEALDREIVALVTRTGMVFTATTLLFAVFALRSTSGKSLGAIVGTVLLAIALVFAAIAFVSALTPLWTSLRKAWRKPYLPRAFVTLFRHDSCTKWAWYSWVGDRRTPVATKYKRAHSIVVPMLISAAILIVPGLVLSLIYK